MDPVDVDFLQQLRATFAAEAQEHLQVVTAGLLELERELPVERRRAVVENVFRAAHSLKGAARAVEFGEIESVCQALEDSFAAWKQQDSGPTAVALDALHARLNRLAKLLAPASPPAPAPPPVAAAAAAARLQPEPAVPLVPNLDVSPRAPGPETVRVRADVLDARLLEVEELLAVKLAARQRVEELRELALQVQGWHGADTMVPGPAQLQALELALASSARAAERDRDTTARLVDDLLANVKQLLLLPFGAITAGLPKLVRDLCRAQGKEAELRIEGEDIPLDKRILDALRDPLLHLLRNCIDHGVEPPAERQRRGKPARAQVRLAATPLAGHRVQITLADDGAGLDLAGIQAAAVRQGLVGAQEAAQLAPQEAQALVFRSGLSTRTEVTDLSGRGLGLAIVQENVTRLGGEVTVESRPGAGTVFRLVLPARRASFRGILVRAAGQLLVVPTRQVERVARIPADAVRSLDERDAITLDGR
ncbi:MAG TPA: ATP-binding protein, partial [Ramlibacter sp.]|nr:ATP-binding protein [Ramlibacter sp.]